MKNTAANQRVLLYSHDSYGLGHLRRNLSIASAVSAKSRQVLVLTGSTVSSAFSKPKGTDFISMPGMVKTGQGTYVPTRLGTNTREVTRLRTSIILAAVKNYQPDVFVVDKVPLGLLGEVRDALLWLKQRTACKLVLGLRDILDDPETIAREWDSQNTRHAITELYDEIWIYGCRPVYDAIAAYPLLAQVADKVLYTGYLHGTQTAPNTPHETQKNVLVTVGGGGDGARLLETFIDYYEQSSPVPFPAVMVSGPLMPRHTTRALSQRCTFAGVRFHHFHKQMDYLIDTAKLVICMGGYNTVCETLARKKACIIVPRKTPRREQTLRAEVFARLGLATHLPFDQLVPEKLGNEIHLSLERGPNAEHQHVQFSGRHVIRKRVNHFLEERP